MVQYDAVEVFGNPVLCDNHDHRIDAFRKVSDAAKAHGSLFFAQLSHPGRQGSATLNPNPVSASDVQLEIACAGNWFAKPRALNIPENKDMVTKWGETARLCYQAGFDGVQIHCAHGYLLAQFLSETQNKRTDDYGGDFENRGRIIFENIDEVKRVVPDDRFIMCVMLNSVKFQPGGQTADDCRNLCLKLEEAGVDFLDLSGETFEGWAFEHKKEITKAREAYFIEFAEAIRPLLKKTVLYVTGMAGAIRLGACDGIGIGRPLGAEPYLCKEILKCRVHGAIENFVPLPKNTQATRSQLHQIGLRDKLIGDWSDEKEVKRWLYADRVEKERKIAILSKMVSSGYPRIEAQSGFKCVRSNA